MALLHSNGETIDLEQTNRLARMLVRTDRKYVLSFDQLQSLITDIGDLYYTLEIDGISQFSYLSCYYDDRFGCYLEHHQARRQRIKVRTREYVDSGLKFFEVKLKGLRGKTCRQRINQGNMISRPASAPPIKCPTYIPATLFSAQTRLGGSISAPTQAGGV